MPALLCAMLLPMTALGADKWPTTRFKVFAGNPYVGDALGLGSSYFEFEDVVGGPDDDAIAEIERAFSEAAKWYQDRGFPAPALEPLKKDDQGLYYQVYVCSEDLDQWLWDNAWNLVGAYNSLTESPWDQCGADPFDSNDVKAGLYYPACPQVRGRKKLMIVNSDQSLGSNGKLNELGYQTIAHEMMHAVMASTPFGKSNSDCSVYGWITEGIPDAIGYDIAEDLWKGRYAEESSSGHVIKRYGYRPYKDALPQNGVLDIPGQASPKVPGTYSTSSFWRFIADSHPDGWSVLVKRPRSLSKAPGLLQVPLPSGGGWRRELKWLQTGLRSKFNLRASELHSLFVTYLPYQVAPMKTYDKPPSKENWEHWVHLLFGSCARVRLEAGGSQEFNLGMQGMAARCVWVETVPNGFVEVTFQAAGTKEELEAISIGLAGTTIVTRAVPIVETKNGPASHLASWRNFPQDGAKNTLYVISNFDPEPEDSIDRNITFTASIPNNTNTARGASATPPAKVAKRPLKPTNRKHAPSLAKQKSQTSKMVKEQVNLDKKSLNPNVSNSTSFSRRPNSASCEEPFRYQACGPQISIGLTMMPGTYANLGGATTQGGAGGQVMGALSATATTSTMDSEETMRYLAELTDTIDGHSVHIVFPLVDYGSGASFSNASISVAMAGGKTYSAIGPLDENNWPPLTGQVTIEEYSPFIIRGTFSANLAEFLPGAGPNDKPIWTSRGNVSGSFTSVAPFTEDERNIVIMDSHEQIADDAMNALGISPVMANRLKEEGKIPGGSGNAGGGGGGGSTGGAVSTPECTCECEMKEFADDLCNMLCEEEFAACK